MRVCFWLIVCMPLVVGCEDPYAAGVPAGKSPATSAPLAPSSPAAHAEPHTTAPVEPSDEDSPSIGDASSPAEEQPVEYEREVAEVGVGKQGRNYGGGVITEPIRQNFRLQQRIVFLKIDQDLRVFQAAHDRLPNSHEEFMEKIINESNIPLPELPAGERFVWDPERGELMVERPRTAP